MGVIALSQHLDAERDDPEMFSLTLVAVRYVGDRSAAPAAGAINQQGQWPGTGLFNGASGDFEPPWYFGLVPDGGLGYLEARDDLELVYADDTEAFARALLSKSRLPENVFDRGADRNLQDRVYDALGIENPVEAGPVDEQLRRLANLDADEDAPAVEDDGEATRTSRYVDGYTRADLKDAVTALREDASEFSLRGAKKHDMAAYLAEHDEEAVAAALQSAGDGGD